MTDTRCQDEQTQAATDPADDLRVLYPDVDVEVTCPDTGEIVTLTVREFRFREGLEVTVLARPLIEGLTGLALAAAAGDSDAEPDTGEVAAILGLHADLWLDLIGRACGRDADWIGRLGDEDAYHLGIAMWDANGPFFCRRVVDHEAAKTALGGLLASLRYSPPSPPQATAATIMSGAQ